MINENTEKEAHEFPISTYYRSCSFCGRKFLIQEVLIGVSHTLDIAVTCAECLRKNGINKKYIEEHPKDAKEIQKWLDKEDSNE